MKLRTYCSILLILICGSAFGQEIKVKGIITDSLSGNAEVAAIVQFYIGDDKSKPIAYTTTDENGAFSHNLSQEGEYRLFLDNMGKKAKSVYFTIKGQTEIDLGNITVQDNATTLEAGRVTALNKLIAIDADKVTYKVENDVESKTKSVLDILRKIPLVNVDGLGRITVNGNSSFLVYVDGIKNQMMSENPTEVFRSMPASMIKEIEVITDPGARYDAEGVGGVLNITTFRDSNRGKTEDLFNGSVSLGGSLRRINPGANFSIKKNKLSLSANLDGSYLWERGTITTSDRIQSMTDGEMKTTSRGSSDNNSYNSLGNISGSYEISEHDLISFSGGILNITTQNKAFNSTSIEMGGSEFKYDDESRTNLRLNLFNANIDYQHNWKDKPGQMFIVSYQINGRPSRNWYDSKYTPVSDPVSGLTDIKEYVFSNSLTHTAQTDFVIPFKNHKLNTGAKLMIRHNITDTDSNLDYDFYNNIGALYAEYNGNLKRFKLRAGLRYEHTWQNATYNDMREKDFRLNYGNLVPNGSIQFDINDTQNIGLTYSSSIRRPGITYLNPYIDMTDPSSKKYGNPDLKAEKGHQIGLRYNFFSAKWIVSMRLQQVFKNNGISSYTFYDKDHILNTTYGNIINSSRSSINAYISWSPGPKTRMSLNGTAAYNIFKSEELDMAANRWQFDVMADIQQILPKEYILNFTCMYLPYPVTLQTRSNGIWNASLALSKSFFNDRLNVSLTAMSNISNQMLASIRTVTTGKDFISTDEMLMHWKDVFIAVTYRFGSEKNIRVKQSKKHKTQGDQLELE